MNRFHFTLILICGFNICFASDKYLSPPDKFKWGVSTTANFNPYINPLKNLKYSAYNGGDIGTYLALNLKKVRLDLGLNYGLANYNFSYTHPQFQDHFIRENKTIHRFYIDLLFSRKIYNTSTSHFSIGTGISFGADSRIHDDDKRELITESFYDAGIGRENNRLMIFRKSNGGENAVAFLVFHFTYHAYHPKFTYFIRFKANVDLVNPDVSRSTIIAYDRQQNQLEIEQINFRDPRHLLSLSFGWDLWQSNNKD